MTGYLYRIGKAEPEVVLERVVSYTADQAVLEDGGVCGPFAQGWELSSLPDCSETLRADWREAHPDTQKRIEELETLMAELLFGGESLWS